MKTPTMFNQFLSTAKAAVSDINNYLKTNAEICMDFMLRLNGQASSVENVEVDFSLNPVATVSKKYELGFTDQENFGCLEENY